MALLDRLPGVLTRDVTVGAYINGGPTGRVYGGKVRAVPQTSGPVVHLASGDAVYLTYAEATFDAQGKATLTLIRSDTPGLGISPAEGGKGFDWDITVTLLPLDDEAAPAPITKRVYLDGKGTGAVDLEKVAETKTPITPSGGVVAVRSIAGLTGAITAQQLSSLLPPPSVADGSLNRVKFDAETQGILDNAATGGLADGGVTSVKLADLSVPRRAIITGAVDEPQLSADVITKINAGGVADAGVTEVKLAPLPLLKLNTSGPRDIRRYGAKVDGRVVADAVTTNGSTTVTSATAAFTSADVGKRLTVWNASAWGTNTQATHAATVMSVTSATQAVVSPAVPFAATGRNLLVGTDDTVAVKAAVVAATSTGGAVYFPSGVTVITQELTIPGGVSLIGDGFSYATPAYLIGRGSVLALGADIGNSSMVILGSDPESSETADTGASIASMAFEGNHLCATTVKTNGRRNYVTLSQFYHGKTSAYTVGGQNGYHAFNVYGQNGMGDVVVMKGYADNKVTFCQMREFGVNGAGIRLQDSSGDVTITNNHMFGGANATPGQPGNNIVVESSCKGLTISDNQMDCANGHNILIKLPNAGRLLAAAITNNLFFTVNNNGNGWSMIRIDESATSSQVQSMLVAGNQHFSTVSQSGAHYAADILSTSAGGTTVQALSVLGNSGEHVRDIVTGLTPEAMRDNVITRNGVTLAAGEPFVALSDARGVATFNGDATTKTFTITHGLGLRSAGRPGFYSIIPLTTPAGEPRTVTATATTLTVTYATAPATGSGNVSVAWEAAIAGNVATAPPPAIPPAKVTGLAAGAPSATTQTLSWSAASGATGYAVESKKTTATLWNDAGSTSGTAFTVTGLTAVTDYDYRVTATNASGGGPTSDVLAAQRTAAAGTAPTGALVADRFVSPAGGRLSGRAAADGTQSQPVWATTSADPNARVTIVTATGEVAFTAGNQITYALLDTGLTAYRVRTSVPKLLANAVDRRAIFTFRSADDKNTWRLASHTDGAWKLQKVTGNTGTVVFTGPPAAPGDVLEAVVTATTVEARINGTSLGVATDSTHSTATKVGIGGQFSAGASTVVDPTSTFGPIEVFAS